MAYGMDVLTFPLSRLCYAAHAEDASEVEHAGLQTWLDRQLNPKGLPGADLDNHLRSVKLQIKYASGNGQPLPNGDTKNWPAVDEMRPFRYLDAPINVT
jgi:hypothetical protein